MSTWPRTLRRWQHELQIFPPEVSTVLGEMMTRLAPALASAARTAHDPSGEPDGYDGLVRRGPFDRLLGSEWALHSAVPLEFLRRATQGELSFLKTAQRTPAARRSMLVLCDAGPQQLGGCRIVQLALLLALSERARYSGSAFGWQALLHLGEQPIGSIDEQSVMGFLAARSALEVSQHAVDGWLERFQGDELWVLGGARVRQWVNGRAHCVELNDMLDPDRDAVQVKVVSSAQLQRELTLQLPEPALAKRVLRNPFELPARLALTPSELPRSNLLLTPDGNHLMFVNAQNEACSVNLGRMQHQQPALRKFSSELPVVAISHRGRRTCWLGAAPGLAVLHASEPLRKDKPATLTSPAPSVAPSTEVWPLITFTSPLSALFVAGDRSLWRLNFENLRPELIAEGVSALCPMGSNFAIAAVASYKGAPAVLELQSTFERVLPFRHSGSAAFLRAHPQLRVVVASEQPQGGFRIESKAVGGDQSLGHNLAPPANHRVVGIDAARHDWSDCALYVLSPDEKTLEVIGRQRSRVVLKSASPIRSVAVASTAGRIAYLTAAGVLGVATREGRGQLNKSLSELA